MKRLTARKPTALVLFTGSEALHYANLADITMIDRYPIPWLPLANFGQHVRLTRLALGKEKPLLAVIQSFDWSYYPELMPGEKNLRPPNYEELRCMTYCALAQRVNGLFFYAYDAGRWKLAEHPESWTALKQVVQELNQRLPLFQAEHLWWPFHYKFQDWNTSFNAALESSVSLALLRVRRGNGFVPEGDYILAVNNTEKPLAFGFASPRPLTGQIPVLEENRSLAVRNHWAVDRCAPYEVHIYGPLPAAIRL